MSEDRDDRLVDDPSGLYLERRFARRKPRLNKCVRFINSYLEDGYAAFEFTDGWTADAAKDDRFG